MRTRARFLIAGLAAIAAASPATRAQEGFRFKSGVDLVNVTADRQRPDRTLRLRTLQNRTSTIFDDGEPAAHHALQQQTAFLSSRHPARHERQHERPTSGRGRAPAINRFIHHAARPAMTTVLRGGSADNVDVPGQSWTTVGRAISRAVAPRSRGGGTALYDAIARVAADCGHRQASQEGACW